MPAKLQIKLLSSHGELLNVVTCYSGQISVFRANATADLKPYQRALTGAHGPERFSINVDGKEYAASEHILIGFGERLPAGMNVSTFLESAQVPAASIESLLLSYGMDTAANKDCSALSEDEKRRLQILSALYHPDRVLVLNEPFDPISSSWRERFADLLSNFVRQKKALIVVTALSYRPECWIDNESVARIQVGESLQRTVGFGGNSADLKNFVNQIRESVKEEQPKPTSQSSTSFTAAASAAGLVATGASQDLGNSSSLRQPADAPSEWSGSADNLSSIPDLSSFARYLPLLRRAAPLLGAVGAVAVGMVLLRDKTPGPDSGSPTGSETVAVASRTEVPLDVAAIPTAQAQVDVSVSPPNQPPSPPVMGPPQYVLDEYPEDVRICLLDTMNGVIPEANTAPNAETNPNAANQPPPGQAKNGNIFKLLESASSNVPDRPGSDTGPFNSDFPPPPMPPGEFPPPPDAISPPFDEAEEQAKREAIRQKFLEAIRAAAERRAAEGQ